MHVALPLAVLYVLSAQATHVPPLGPVKPGLQVQAVAAVLETGEFELAGHAVQKLATVAPVTVEYLPETQSVHNTLPAVPVYFPAVQDVHVGVPGVPLNFPARHCVHVPPLGPDAPALQMQAVSNELEAGEYELPGHAVQKLATVAPVTVEYLPETQSVHNTLPGVPVYFPAVQDVHVAVPGVPVYFPARHSAHGPPFSPDAPALQVQAASAELESGEFELVGHARHVVEVVADNVLEYVPVGHPVHAASLIVSLYLPAPHPAQVPPFDPV